jgi:hypothetical protein
MVELASLHIDPKYQRELKKSRATKIAKSFDLGAIKAINISRRSDGRLFITDGQHTADAARDAGFTHFPAIIVAGTQEQEARWFGIINGAATERVKVSVKHKAALVARDETAMAIQTILDTYNLKISTGGLRAGHTNAVGTISRYFAACAPQLQAAMDAIRMLWSVDDCAWSGVVIRGMFELAASPELLRDAIVRLRRRKTSPRQVMDIASALQTAAGATGGGGAHAKAAILKAAGIKFDASAVRRGGK